MTHSRAAVTPLGLPRLDAGAVEPGTDALAEAVRVDVEAVQLGGDLSIALVDAGLVVVAVPLAQRLPDLQMAFRPSARACCITADRSR